MAVTTDPVIVSPGYDNEHICVLSLVSRPVNEMTVDLRIQELVTRSFIVSMLWVLA